MDPQTMIAEMSDYFRAGASDCRSAALAALSLVLVICAVRYIVALLRPAVIVRGEDDH
jgi:hypothetical protein